MNEEGFDAEVTKTKKAIIIFKIFGWLFVALGFIVFIIGLYYWILKRDDFNEVGDFVGGVSGSLWALAGLFFIYIAFLGQKIEIKYQQADLKLNREELRESKEVFKAQASIMLDQKLDTTFFNLLDNHRKLVNSFKDRERIRENITGYDALESIHGSLKWYLKKYSSFLKTRNIFDSDITNSNPIDEIERYHIIKILYDEVSGIIAFISKKIREENKEFYFNTLFNNLSTQEKFLLTAYNINMSNNYKAELDFKGYLKYNFRDFSKEEKFLTQKNIFLHNCYPKDDYEEDIIIKIVDDNPNDYDEFNLYLVDKEKKLVTHVKRINKIHQEIPLTKIITDITEKYFSNKIEKIKNDPRKNEDYYILLEGKNSKYNFIMYSICKIQIEIRTTKVKLSAYRDSNNHINDWIQNYFNNLENQQS
ncbi:hypothetical protein H2O64_09355 [Kordia sp. YSTF-M3]|uniref:Phage abortive infection protein n=1 Tax=Kordia aestuariivivens TaxID=2759037 RepID=A0ABR7Q8I3_9FLAO|nr:UbiA family prenyltransferase [Kordia aestuariivivens]MBC8754876.1 hypothetical protein [Kordia aestuariivivens]